LLPYWYFINRAFGVPSVGGAGKLAEDLNDRSANPLLEALDAHQLNALLLLHSLKQQEQLQVQVQVRRDLRLKYASYLQLSLS